MNEVFEVPVDPDIPMPETAPFCPFDRMAMVLESDGWRCEVCDGGYEHGTMAWVPPPLARYWQGR